MQRGPTNLDGRLPPAFVLGGDTNALGIVRCLGRAGIKIFAVAAIGNSLAFHSRHCSPVPSPDPSANPEEVLDLMLDKGRELDHKGIVIPTSDAWVLFVSRNRKGLCRYFVFDSPPEEAVEASINKRLQYNAAKRIGIPFPKTLFPSSLKDLEELRGEIEFPAFIKPYNSHLWGKVFGCKGFPARSYRELKEKFAAVVSTGLEAMVQSVVIGPSSNHHSFYAYLDENSEPIALFVHEKIRQHPTDFGNATMVEGVHDDEVVKLGLKFLQDLGYRGMGFVEFKRDSRDNELKLIELNPRQVLPNPAPVYAGVNFPLIQYKYLAGLPIDPPPDWKEGVRWVETLRDFRAYWSLRNQGLLTFSEWVRSWLSADCHANFARDDPLPALVRARYGLALVETFVEIMKERRGSTGKPRDLNLLNADAASLPSSREG